MNKPLRKPTPLAFVPHINQCCIVRYSTVLYTDTYSCVCKKLRHQFDSRVDGTTPEHTVQAGEVCSAVFRGKIITFTDHGMYNTFRGVASSISLVRPILT